MFKLKPEENVQSRFLACQLRIKLKQRNNGCDNLIKLFGAISLILYTFYVLVFLIEHRQTLPFFIYQLNSAVRGQLQSQTQGQKQTNKQTNNKEAKSIKVSYI
jgi:hypothetical protein